MATKKNTGDPPGVRTLYVGGNRTNQKPPNVVKVLTAMGLGRFKVVERSSASVSSVSSGPKGNVIIRDGKSLSQKYLKPRGNTSVSIPYRIVEVVPLEAGGKSAAATVPSAEVLKQESEDAIIGVFQEISKVLNQNTASLERLLSELRETNAKMDGILTR